MGRKNLPPQIHNRNKHLKGDKSWQMWRLRLQQVQGRKNLPQTAANYRANSCPITKGWWQPLDLVSVCFCIKQSDLGAIIETIDQKSHSLYQIYIFCCHSCPFSSVNQWLWAMPGCHFLRPNMSPVPGHPSLASSGRPSLSAVCGLETQGPKIQPFHGYTTWCRPHS